MLVKLPGSSSKRPWFDISSFPMIPFRQKRKEKAIFKFSLKKKGAPVDFQFGYWHRLSLWKPYVAQQTTIFLSSFYSWRPNLTPLAGDTGARWPSGLINQHSWWRSGFESHNLLEPKRFFLVWQWIFHLWVINSKLVDSSQGYDSFPMNIPFRDWHDFCCKNRPVNIRGELFSLITVGD